MLAPEVEAGVIQNLAYKPGRMVVVYLQLESRRKNSTSPAPAPAPAPAPDLPNSRSPFPRTMSTAAGGIGGQPGPQPVRVLSAQRLQPVAGPSAQTGPSPRAGGLVTGLTAPGNKVVVFQVKGHKNLNQEQALAMLRAGGFGSYLESKGSPNFLLIQPKQNPSPTTSGTSATTLPTQVFSGISPGAQSGLNLKKGLQSLRPSILTPSKASTPVTGKPLIYKVVIPASSLIASTGAQPSKKTRPDQRFIVSQNPQLLSSSRNYIRITTPRQGNNAAQTSNPVTSAAQPNVPIPVPRATAAIAPKAIVFQQKLLPKPVTIASQGQRAIVQLKSGSGIALLSKAVKPVVSQPVLEVETTDERAMRLKEMRKMQLQYAQEIALLDGKGTASPSSSGLVRYNMPTNKSGTLSQKPQTPHQPPPVSLHPSKATASRISQETTSNYASSGLSMLKKYVTKKANVLLPLKEKTGPKELLLWNKVNEATDQLNSINRSIDAYKETLSKDMVDIETTTKRLKTCEGFNQIVKKYVNDSDVEGNKPLCGRSSTGHRTLSVFPPKDYASKGKRVFPCLYCRRKYKLNGFLVRHVEDRHPDRYDEFIARITGKGQASTSLMKKPVPETGVRCLFCKQTFNGKSPLICHIKEVHPDSFGHFEAITKLFEPQGSGDDYSSVASTSASGASSPSIDSDTPIDLFRRKTGKLRTGDETFFTNTTVGLQCFFCPKKFNTTTLLRHVKRVHSPFFEQYLTLSNLLNCRSLKKLSLLSPEGNLLPVEDTDEFGNPIVRCYYCPAIHSHRQSLVGHMRVDHSEVYQTYVDISTLYKKKGAKINPKPKTSASSRVASVALNMARKRLEKNKKHRHTCEACGEPLASRVALVIHTRFHCPLLQLQKKDKRDKGRSSTTSQRATLVDPSLLPGDKKPRPASSSLPFAAKVSWKRNANANSHVNNKPKITYFCDAPGCGMSFPIFRLWKSHRSSHRQPTALFCDGCDKMFTVRIAFTNHRKACLKKHGLPEKRATLEGQDEALNANDTEEWYPVLNPSPCSISSRQVPEMFEAPEELLSPPVTPSVAPVLLNGSLDWVKRLCLESDLRVVVTRLSPELISCDRSLSVVVDSPHPGLPPLVRLPLTKK